MDDPAQQKELAGSLRTRLREASMPAHRKLEAVVDEHRFFETEDGYAIWLRTMQDCHCKFAAEYDAGSKRLGMRPLSSELLTALAQDTGRFLKPECTIRSIGPESVGAAYVFEGSAMGARIVRKRVSFLPDVPVAYLNMLIETSWVRWPEIKQKLSQMETETDLVVARAITLFGSLSSTFKDLKE